MILCVSLLVNTIVSHPCKKKEYTLTYVVFYPGYPDTITVHNNAGYNYYSYQGSNYIKDYSSNLDIYNGSAPFKVLRYSSRIIKSK